MKLFKKDNVQLNFGDSKEITEDENAGLYLWMGNDSLRAVGSGDVNSFMNLPDGTQVNKSDNTSFKSGDVPTEVVFYFPEAKLEGKYNRVQVMYGIKDDYSTVDLEVKIGGVSVAKKTGISTTNSDWTPVAQPMYLDKTNVEQGQVTLTVTRTAKGTNNNSSGNVGYIRFYYDDSVPLFEKGDAVGGYYTDNNTAAGDDDNAKKGIIRFFQQYQGNNNISQYGFYFVDGETGDILDDVHYIYTDDPYSSIGFYGDLMDAKFDTPYYAKAFVRIGEETYMSESIEGKADKDKWVKKPENN